MRSTMLHERFNDFTIINIKKDLAKQINNQDPVDIFLKKNQYIVLIKYVLLDLFLNQVYK